MKFTLTVGTKTLIIIKGSNEEILELFVWCLMPYGFSRIGIYRKIPHYLIKIPERSVILAFGDKSFFKWRNVIFSDSITLVQEQ